MLFNHLREKAGLPEVRQRTAEAGQDLRPWGLGSGNRKEAEAERVCSGCSPAGGAIRNTVQTEVTLSDPGWADAHWKDTVK